MLFLILASAFRVAIRTFSQRYWWTVFLIKLKDVRQQVWIGFYSVLNLTSHGGILSNATNLFQVHYQNHWFTVINEWIEQALNPFSFLKYFLFDNIFYFKKLIFNIKSKNTKNKKNIFFRNQPLISFPPVFGILRNVEKEKQIVSSS